MSKSNKVFKSILFFVNDLQYFYSHRFGLADTCLKKNFKVYIVYGEKGNIDINKLKIDNNLLLVNCPFQRNSTNLKGELKTFIKFFNICRSLQPDLIHLINLKPYLYGGLVSKALSIPSVSSITGLGFTNKYVYKSKFYKSLILFLLKIIFNRKNHIIIVQNKDDKSFLESKLNINKNIINIIKGTGINLEKYKFKKLPNPPYNIVFPGRFIKEKGIIEFIEASKLLKNNNPKINFWIVGEFDQKARSLIKKENIQNWEKIGLIKCLGYKEDLCNIFSKAHIVCLPSYQEGFPRVLIEAAACGRAIITTNVPGCREAIIPNKSGILANVRDSQDLAKKIKKLIQNPIQIEKMSKISRNFAEKNFNDNHINNKHLRIYKKLLFKT